MSPLPPGCAPARTTAPARSPRLLTLALLLDLAVGVGAPQSDAAAADRRQDTVSVHVLPPIWQTSGRPASLSRALTPVAVTVTPPRAGRQLTLEQRVGSTWRVVGTQKTGSRGRADFFVPGRDGRRTSFRAALGSGGSPQRRSDAVEDTWGAPDFVDEFDGTALAAAWEHRIQFYNPWGGRACSMGSPTAVSVGGGVLRLSSMVDPTRSDLCSATNAQGQPIGTYPYRLNGHISTQSSADFLYGVAAARMRFPETLGQHVAFWLQPRGLLTTGPTPWGAEVDIVEWFGSDGKRSRMSSTVHAPLPDGSKQQIGGAIARPDRFLLSRTDSWWQRFHVFSVEWTPTEYVFRIGGHEVWRTSQGVSHVPEFLILSVLSSDFELPWVGADSSPRTAEVDWVAFWQR